MVALQKDRALDQKPEYVAFSLIFILCKKKSFKNGIRYSFEHYLGHVHTKT